MINVVPIPAFNDNYIWMISDNSQAWVVDPGDAQPVLAALETHNLELAGILVTHHHFDHIGGVAKLVKTFQVPVIGNPDKIAQITDNVKEGDNVELLNTSLKVISVPGHTLDHIAYFGELPGTGPSIFCGDTLFSAGCGRLFEGTAAQMLTSLEKLAELPAETKVFCAHEYTLANLAFAKASMPGNQAVEERISACEKLRSQGLPTLPVTLAEEKTYNPFLMARHPDKVRSVIAGTQVKEDDPVSIFAALRSWKDRF